MFDSDSLYSVSSQHWEDLENISLPSLPFQLQFPDTPLEDEADQSDMTPHGISVIDPQSVRDCQLEMCMMSSMGQATITAESLLSDYMSRWEVADHFSRLHVLVCGCCNSVFHVIDQFRSHTTFCVGVKDTRIPTDTTVPGLALVLWTNTVLRLVRDQLGVVAEQEALTRKIENKWFRLSNEVKIGWEKAAQILRDISSVHDNISPRPEPGGGPGHEQGEVMSDQEDSEQGDAVKMNTSQSETSVGDKSGDSAEADTLKEKVEKKPKHYGYRNKKGRWEAKNVEAAEKKCFKCEECSFTTVTEWKLKRHESTKKHLETVENVNMDAESSSSIVKIEGINILDCEELNEETVVGVTVYEGGETITDEVYSVPMEESNLVRERIMADEGQGNESEEDRDGCCVGMEPLPDCESKSVALTACEMSGHSRQLDSGEYTVDEKRSKMS